jgi:hypothetical protein
MTPFFARLTTMLYEMQRRYGADATITEITLSDRAWWAVATEVQKVTPMQIDWTPDRDRPDSDVIRFEMSGSTVLVKRESREGAKKGYHFD